MENAILTHEQALALIARAQAGDEQAREQLVVKNTALVKSIVRGYLHRGADYEDLLQIGSIGLLKAIDGYDASFGVRFSTYAVPMISGEIKRFLRDDGMIKVSRALKEHAIQLYRAQEQLKKQLGRAPTIEELSVHTGIPPEDAVQALDAVREPVSLYEPMFKDADGKTLLIDTMANQGEEDSLLIDRLLLKELIGKLSERERRIILLRFFRDKTQSEIAEIIGVSQVQISRLLVKTLERLREEAGR